MKSNKKTLIRLALCVISSLIILNMNFINADSDFRKTGKLKNNITLEGKSDYIKSSPRITEKIKSDVDRKSISVAIVENNQQKTIRFNDDMGYPAIIDGRTYIPLRIISEDLGYDVKWDQKNWKVSVSNKENKMELVVGENYAIVNGKKVSLDEVSDGNSKNTKSFISDSRTYVPLRFISEAFGAKVDYSRNKGHNYITISMDKKVEKPVKGEWIEPSFYMDVYNKNGNFDFNLLLLNQKKLTESGNDISMKVKWNKSDWEDYLHGYKYSVLEKDYYKFDYRNNGMYNEEKFVPNGTVRASIFRIAAYGDSLNSDKTPIKNPKGKVLKLNVEVTQNGVTKTYPFEYVVK